jgi:hypothetical protein
VVISIPFRQWPVIGRQRKWQACPFSPEWWQAEPCKENSHFGLLAKSLVIGHDNFISALRIGNGKNTFSDKKV